MTRLRIEGGAAKRFPTKRRLPFRVKETRQTKNLDTGSDFVGTEKPREAMRRC